MPRARILGLAALLAIPFGPVTAGRASTPSVIVFSADRAPQLSNEIYRVDPNGHRVELNGSPFGDDRPLVSPSGREVAFLSYRSVPIGQGPRLYEVRIDGTHLLNLRPSLVVDDFVWQPHGDRLAAISSKWDATRGLNLSELWIFRRGHSAKLISSIKGVLLDPSWSPDGRVLVAWSGYAWRAFSPTGRRLWARRAKNGRACCGTSWSPRGLLATTTRQQIRIFDERGRKRLKARIPTGGTPLPSWSPNGQEVGFVADGDVEVWTVGGRLVLRKRVPRLGPHRPNVVVWENDRTLVAGLPNTGPFEGVDVRTGTVRTASGRWFDPRSADGKLRIVTPKTGTNFAVGVAPVSGGPTDSYGQLPACGQDTPPVTSLQFVGRSRSIVYETVCTHPFYDLYSIAPDGTGLREISGIQPNAGAPALSSDGTQIAYTWAPPRGLSGSEIRVANADGTDARTLVSATSNCTSEDPPTWSPDGKTILYSETTIGFTSACPGDPGSELYTIPAVGGARHDLGVAGSYPIWGPTRIAYAGPEGLTTANPDGSDPIVVATLSGVRAWSSDGRLAYMAFDPSPTVIVGSQPVQLPFVQVTSLGWSPDGTRFVVTAQKTKKAPLDLYTVKTDGTDWLRLTRNYDTLGASWR